MRIEKLIKTTDDWYPNIKDNKVRIFVHYRTGSGKNDSVAIIAVWGNDDYGLEMQFKGSADEAEKKFNEWKQNIYDKVKEPCTKAYFKKLGFREA